MSNKFEKYTIYKRVYTIKFEWTRMHKQLTLCKHIFMCWYCVFLGLVTHSYLLLNYRGQLASIYKACW